jgi:hypothetical protein
LDNIIVQLCNFKETQFIPKYSVSSVALDIEEPSIIILINAIEQYE